MAKPRKEYQSPDGTTWAVVIGAPGSSNAMVLFRHPDGRRSGLDRYAWLNWQGRESQNVTSRLERPRVLDALSSEDVARLFRRSMPVSSRVTRVGV